MTELTTASSFVVRVYRVDTEDPQKLIGMIEAMDGSGERLPFNSVEDLAAVLRSVADNRGGSRKKAKHGQAIKKMTVGCTSNRRNST